MAKNVFGGQIFNTLRNVNNKKFFYIYFKPGKDF